MDHRSIADCYTQALIGSTIQEVEALLGVPFASHHADGKLNQVHLIGDNYTTISYSDGKVEHIDHEAERRIVPRIKPSFRRPAHMRIGTSRFRCIVTCISQKSGVFEVSTQDSSGLDAVSSGHFMTACMSFRVRQNTCSFISLAGRILKIENNKITVLWDVPFETHSTRVLREYISSHLALESIGKRPAGDATDAVPHEETITIIKSDLCVFCTEGVCGLQHNPHQGEIIPFHGGIR